jgi:hypothetical protein
MANLPPISMTPAANFATSFDSFVDTRGKFATGANLSMTLVAIIETNIRLLRP